MPRFDRAQVLVFLRELDVFLKEDLTIFVIGGSAALLGYHADIKTADLDVYQIIEGSSEDLSQAARLAFDVTGIDFTVSRASVAELPYNYEDRIRPVRGIKLKKLTMIIPDKYDLVLSKAVRGDAHDLEAIQSVHEHHPLSEKTLATRFEDEIWKIANTDPRNFAITMAVVMEMLYGKERAGIYRERWGLNQPRKPSG